MSTRTDLPHGHVTLLFTDVEDSTPMNAALGNDLYRQRMQTPLFDRLKACITEQNGHLSGTPAGDSLFAVFQEPEQGLACAKAMQERVSQSPITFTHDGKEWQMKVRIGVHTSEKQMFADDESLFHGEDVNFASRVMSLGKGGQVLVSSACYKVAGSRQQYDFHAWEGRLLKGIAQPAMVYELLWTPGQKPVEPGNRWLPAWMRKYSDAFIGREELLNQIAVWVRGETPMLILHGPGGIGKTRLAVQGLLRMIDMFEGRAYGVALDEEFGSVPASVSPEQLAAAIARAVHAPKDVLDNPLTLLAPFLEAGKPSVVLLDNGESALNDQTVTWLGEFLWNIKKVRWLVSSRFDPGLEPLTETLTVSLLSLPKDETQLPDEDSYRLFKARVESRQPPLDISDTGSLLRILHATAGFPLAIELVAAQRHFRTLKEIADGLDKSLLDWQSTRRKAGQRRGDKHRHQSMEACIHWSVQMLPIEEQRLYSHLGIFAFDFNATAAEVIADVPDTSLDTCQVTNLIERIEPNHTTRYRLLPVFREYATRRQQDWLGDATDLSQRYVQHYVGLISANANVNVPTQKAVLDAEWRNALQAAEIAAETDERKALLALANGLRDYLYLSIYGAEAIRLQELALQAAQRIGDVLEEANCTVSLGALALVRSDHETARQRYEQAQPLYRQVGSVLGETDCIKSLGDIALRRSDYETALPRYEQALPLYRQVGSVLGEAICIQSLGDIALACFDHETARQRYEQAQPLFRQVGSVQGEANCIKSLGNIALDRSDHETALKRYEQALSLYRQVGDVLGEADCILRLGVIALRRSDHETARLRYEQALPLFRQVGDVVGEANCIDGLGDIALRRSDYETARQRYEQAQPLFRQVGSVLGEANCIKSLGDIALEHSDYETARQRYEQAQPLYRQVGSMKGEADCIKGLGDIALDRSDHDTAWQRYEQAQPLYRQVGYVLGEANCIKGLGDIALERSDHDTARKRFEQVLEMYGSISEPYSIGWTLRRLARISRDETEQKGHVQAARDAWTSIGRDDLVKQLDTEFG